MLHKNRNITRCYNIRKVMSAHILYNDLLNAVMIFFKFGKMILQKMQHELDFLHSNSTEQANRTKWLSVKLSFALRHLPNFLETYKNV